MKRIAMLLLVVCIGVSQAKTAKTGWELRGFKGRVKQCEESDKNSKWIFQFDSIGNEISCESYSFNADKKKFVQDGKIIRNFTYDTKRNVVMKVQIEGSKKDTITYKYDSLNRITSETNYSTSTTTINKYDGKGNLVESSDYDLKGNDAGVKTIYSYDTAGLLVEMDYNSNESESM